MTTHLKISNLGIGRDEIRAYHDFTAWEKDEHVLSVSTLPAVMSKSRLNLPKNWGAIYKETKI